MTIAQLSDRCCERDYLAKGLPVSSSSRSCDLLFGKLPRRIDANCSCTRSRTERLPSNGNEALPMLWFMECGTTASSGLPRSILAFFARSTSVPCQMSSSISSIGNKLRKPNGRRRLLDGVEMSSSMQLSDILHRHRQLCSVCSERVQSVLPAGIFRVLWGAWSGVQRA